MCHLHFLCFIVSWCLTYHCNLTQLSIWDLIRPKDLVYSSETFIVIYLILGDHNCIQWSKQFHHLWFIYCTHLITFHCLGISWPSSVQEKVFHFRIYLKINNVTRYKKKRRCMPPSLWQNKLFGNNSDLLIVYYWNLNTCLLFCTWL